MASELQIPLFYHPTNTVMLDDNRTFLTDVCLILEDEIPYVSDDDPEKIISYLKSHTYRSDDLSNMVVKPVFNAEEVLDDQGVSDVFSLNFSGLLKMLDSFARYKIATTGLIDRLMKKTDGLAFCKTVKQQKLPVKLVLFTGETGADEAIDALNNNDIDNYLKKSGDPAELADKINQLVLALSWKQFLEWSDSIARLASGHILKPLYDERFAEYFSAVRAKHHIVEFYILDGSCSFLMLDKKGNVKELFVRNEQDFKECYEVAKDLKAPYDVLQDIKSFQKYPFTKTPLGYMKLKSDAWENALVQMDKVPGRELYTAVVDRADIQAKSFNDYRNDEWPEP